MTLIEQKDLAAKIGPRIEKTPDFGDPRDH